jgi:hypothetical protein
MSRLDDLLRTVTWVDDLGPYPLSALDREKIAEEAAQWFVTLRESTSGQQAEFLKWIRRSPHHLIAYFDTVKIDSELSAIGIENLREAAPNQTVQTVVDMTAIVDGGGPRMPEASDKWRSLKKHPIAIVASAMLFTGATVWTVSTNLRVHPAHEREQELTREIAQLQSQLTRTEEALKEATARSRDSQSSPDKPTGATLP